MSDDLLGPTTDRPKRKTKSKDKALSTNGGAPNPVSRLVALYHETFLARFGFPPKKGDMPRLAKVAKEMVDSWGADSAADVVARFFTTRDPRIAGSDYSVSVLQRSMQSLMMQRRSLDPKTAANAYEVAKATGRDR